MSHSSFRSPLTERYASEEMSKIFSNQKRYSTFRKLWLELAKAQKKIGLDISDDQINEMQANLNNIDFQKVGEYEKKFRHDVMAHIHAFGDKCPKAKPIIHLGATSCYVTDNADLIIMKEGINLLLSKLIKIIHSLQNFAQKEAATACVGYTHFQPAQPTTIGKRACLWLQDLLMDFKQGKNLIGSIPFLGVKGATGTQASFLNLFEEDEEKVKMLDYEVSNAFNFENHLIISGQTYSRKIDCLIMQFLENIAVSTHKLATDLRLLSHTKELSEKFEKDQVGSSAMPYKKNPIYSERICSLARFLISLSQNPSYTAATQWLERSLDDSANRRISIPEAFLTADSICNIVYSTLQSLFVNHEQINKNLRDHLPYFCMENILMIAVKKGADRQKTHEKLRILAQKEPASFFKELESKKEFCLSKEDIQSACDIKKLTGRSENQVYEFLEKQIKPIVSENHQLEATIPELSV